MTERNKKSLWSLIFNKVVGCFYVSFWNHGDKGSFSEVLHNSPFHSNVFLVWLKFLTKVSCGTHCLPRVAIDDELWKLQQNGRKMGESFLFLIFWIKIQNRGGCCSFFLFYSTDILGEKAKAQKCTKERRENVNWILCTQKDRGGKRKFVKLLWIF